MTTQENPMNTQENLRPRSATAGRGPGRAKSSALLSSSSDSPPPPPSSFRKVRTEYGELMIEESSGKRRFEGFLPFCINVVYDAEAGKWREFEMINGTWAEREVPEELPDCSPAFTEHHQGRTLPWYVEKPKAPLSLPRHLVDLAVELPKPQDPRELDSYKSHYKMVWLCHHRRGLYEKEVVAKRGSHIAYLDVEANVEVDKRRTESVASVENLPDRRLLDRDHLWDVVVNVVAQVVSVLAIYEPITAVFDDSLSSIEHNQESLSYKRLVGSNANGTDWANVIAREQHAENGKFIAIGLVIVVEIFAILSVGFIWEKTIRQIWWYSSLIHGSILIDFANEGEEWAKKHPMVNNLPEWMQTKLNFPFFLSSSAFLMQAWLLFYAPNTTSNLGSKFLALFVIYGALQALYAPVEACQNMENELISLQKFCEKDFNSATDIIKNCVMVPEAFALKRLGDCSRWQIILLARWAETQVPPIKWDYMLDRPLDLAALKLDKKIWFQYRQAQQRLAFDFRMLTIDGDTLPKDPNLFGELSHPYNLNSDSFGFWRREEVDPTSILGKAQKRNCLGSCLETLSSRSSRWSNTLNSLTFERKSEDDNQGCMDHCCQRLCFMWKYIKEVLWNNKRIFECPFDEKMVRWSNNLFLFAFFAGVIASIVLALYSALDTWTLADKIEESCESKLDCSGTTCLQFTVAETGLYFDLAKWIGDGVCNRPPLYGLYYCSERDDTGACIGTEVKKPKFSLDCPAFEKDGGDCLFVSCGVDLKGVDLRADACSLCPNDHRVCSGDCLWSETTSTCGDIIPNP